MFAHLTCRNLLAVYLSTIPAANTLLVFAGLESLLPFDHWHLPTALSAAWTGRVAHLCQVHMSFAMCWFFFTCTLLESACCLQERIADLPTTQVGAVPRYAVLRWALGEDADFWLPLRGKLSRSQLCVWCNNSTRCFPYGPGYGALCPTCFLPATPMDLTLNNLSDESKNFLHFHQIIAPEPKQLPPAFSCLLSSAGCRALDSYVPCVLCQGGFNSIDHWLSFCPVVHLTWRRLVTECGGLRPNILCVHNCKVSHHVLDLWQRIYSSLPSTLLRNFRAPPQSSSMACTDSTKIRLQRFPAVY